MVLNFQIESEELPIACNTETAFDPPRMAVVKRILQMSLKPKNEGHFYRAFEEHLAQQRPTEAPNAWNEGKNLVRSGDLAQKADIWKALKQRLSASYEQQSLYKLAFLAALSPEADKNGAEILQRLRETWGLSWLDLLPLSQLIFQTNTFARSGYQTLSDRDKEIGLALLSLLIHADGSMHAKEVAVFKRSLPLLGFEGRDLSFLKNFAAESAEGLSKKLAKGSLSSLMPLLLRVVCVDASPRPSELRVLEKICETGGISEEERALLFRFTELETGIAVSFS